MPPLLTDEQEAIQSAVREFGENEIKPVAREHDEEKKYPHELVRRAAEYDFAATMVPGEYGGAGLDMLSSALVTEELWRADPGIASAISAVAFSGVVKIIEKYGDEWMKEEWFPKFASAEALTCIAISEPAHGSDVANIETTATRNDDEWVINGNKMWITNATVADVAVLMAKTDPDAGHRGISAFLVPSDTAGFNPHKIDNKLGMNAADLGEIVLDDVCIPEDHILGEENEGFYYLMDTLSKPSRVSVSAQAVGTAQGALDAALEYAQEREQFGQSIGDFQAIQHKLAEMATRTSAARSLTQLAALYTMDDHEMASQMASMSKLYTSETAVDVTDEAIQVHGAAGYVSDHPVERYYRDARVFKIYEGTSEIQKNIISKTLLQ
jgi:alkylation response protein AidB-like acyl-CoA dehydrogenase